MAIGVGMCTIAWWVEAFRKGVLDGDPVGAPQAGVVEADAAADDFLDYVESKYGALYDL